MKVNGTLEIVAKRRLHLFLSSLHFLYPLDRLEVFPTPLREFPDRPRVIHSQRAIFLHCKK